MDEIEQFLSDYAYELRYHNIEQARDDLTRLSKEKFDEMKVRFAHQKKFNTNYNNSRPVQAKEWNSINKTKSETAVLIYIYNLTLETFSLTHSSWDTHDVQVKDLDIEPGGCIPFILRGELLKRTSSGSSAFRSSKIKHEFTYRSGDSAFRFSTLSQLFSKYEPFAFSNTMRLSRQYSTHSIGQSELWCETTLDQNQAASPYSFALSIIIRTP
ncbi:hypothetical protein PS662_04491 [Pseudomonas fluorescens]|uniref:Uncharacterized protein n=1 Tax=Pseudomonas fluorescens TaxID=294 RepID=A0A5E6W3Z3_PSEFL|nr:hypothetical protein [Pseudomonas fluorescens]VVN23444.1 hypothetical protein PS662_04491 [Pseudomonas fluorescens]